MTSSFDAFCYIKNHGKSIYRDLAVSCIFLIRKFHEDSTSQRVCRWSVAYFHEKSMVLAYFIGCIPSDK